jgi:hypothetical protein
MGSDGPIDISQSVRVPAAVSSLHDVQRADHRPARVKLWSANFRDSQMAVFAKTRAMSGSAYEMPALPIASI